MPEVRGSVIERSKQRQALRLQIRGEELLAAANSIADELVQMASGDQCSPAKVGALKAAADIKLRMLDKVLPDLKHVEHDIGEGVLTLKDADRHARINTLMQRLAANGLIDGGSARVGDVALRGAETLQ